MGRAKTENLLPKIAATGGTMHSQFVRCGKAGCKCAGGELHGPYHYLFVRVGDRLRKYYIKPEDVPDVRAACTSRRKRDRWRRVFSKLNASRSLAAISLLRESESEIRAYVEGEDGKTKDRDQD